MGVGSAEVSSSGAKDIVGRPEATAGPVGVVVEDHQLDVLEIFVRHRSERGAGLARTPPRRRDAGWIVVALVLPDRIRNTVGPQQERDDLLLAVANRRRVGPVPAVVRRPREELRRRIGCRNERHQLHRSARPPRVVPVTTAVDSAVTPTAAAASPWLPRLRQSDRTREAFAVLTGHGSLS